MGNITGVRKVSTTSSVHFAASAATHAEAPEKHNIPLPPRHKHPEVTHTLPPQKLEIFKTLEKWAESNLLPRLKPVEECWQPTDLLPDPASESFHEEVGELRRRSRELPDDYLVCLVGDMVTEEALPTYQTFLNNLDGIRDETGASLTPWAVWTRAWTAEENRHGDLLNRYLYLTGRVDMKKIEKTIQYLMRAGMDFRTENNPYSGFIYTSFQERATSISHGNTARMAKAHGDAELARICGTIAAEEKRHEAAYAMIVEKLFEVDPDGTVLAFADRMRKKVSMPACLMFDGRDGDLFSHFSAVAQRVGVYTAKDYADILEFLIRRWKVEELQGLSSEGRAAQEFLSGLAPKIRRLDERVQAKAKDTAEHTMPFSWIFDRQCFRERPCRNDSLKDNRPIVSYKLHAEDLRHKLRRKGLQQQPVSRSYLPWKLIPGSGTTHQRSVKFEKLASALHQQPIESEKLAGYKHQLAASSNLLKYKAVAEPPLNPVPASLNKISQKETELSVDRGLEKYSMTFKVEEVDMPSLKHMTDDDLKTIGLPMGPRKKILLALRPKTQGC